VKGRNDSKEPGAKTTQTRRDVYLEMLCSCSNPPRDQTPAQQETNEKENQDPRASWQTGRLSAATGTMVLG